MTATLPDRFIPTEHIIIGEQYGGTRREIEVVPLKNRRGGIIYGLTPPEYAPTIIELTKGLYRIEQMGNPDRRVNLRERTCSCKFYQEGAAWCGDLGVAAVYEHRSTGERYE